MGELSGKIATITGAKPGIGGCNVLAEIMPVRAQ